jgi:hypothetical protein
LNELKKAKSETSKKMNLKIYQPDDTPNFPPARPITPVIGKHFVTFRKDSHDIFRINYEDGHALNIAYSLLAGLEKAALTPIEIEQMKDLVADLIRSQDGGS